jgi:hypothetical protein
MTVPEGHSINRSIHRRFYYEEENGGLVTAAI